MDSRGYRVLRFVQSNLMCNIVAFRGSQPFAASTHCAPGGGFAFGRPSVVLMGEG